MNKGTFIKFSFLFFVVVFFCCASQTDEKGYKRPEALSQDSINKILKELKASAKAQQLDTLFKNKVKLAGFNGCVLIAQRGQIIYKNAFGFSNCKTKDSLKLNSAFQLASASKTFTATAILMLADQGKLKLTDNVQKFFPNFPYQDITVKLLLSHRSGLFNYIYCCEQYCQKPNQYNKGVFDNAAMMEIITAHKCDVYAKPNTKFEYCNTNYAILASIVEKVTGVSFADYLEQNIFKPLGMDNTWVNNPKGKVVHKNKTMGHKASGVFEDDIYADDVVGDKGVYSTVEDMLKWDQSFYTDQLLKKETIEMAFTGYSNEHKGKRNYGYGWRLTDDGKNPKIVYHNGWWHGYNSLFFRRPADQTTIIVLGNKYNRSTYQIQGVLAILNANAETVEMEE
ncbi:serine hydrolase domain-containing protein [soil metagenome]